MEKKSTKEKIITLIVNLAFVIRYWVIFILFGALVWLTIFVSKQPNIELRDSVAFFAGGLVFITIVFHFLNYEYALRKFNHDKKSSRDLLSFNTALEWQREFLIRNTNLAYKFHKKYGKFLDDNCPKKFHDKLTKDENDQYYDAVFSILNFMESVCLGVKQGIMDEEFVKGFFKTVFLAQYHRYNSYIDFLRRQNQNFEILNNFTELSNKWVTCN